MSRDFDGSSGYLRRADAPVTAAPLTMSCWINHDGQTSLGVLMNIQYGLYGGPTPRFALWYRGDQSGIIAAAATDATGTAQANSASSASSGTWHHAAATFGSTTNRQAWLNGTAGTANTTSKTPPSLDRTYIGAGDYTAGGDDADSFYFNGRIAEAGIWNVALTSAEMGSLAKGVSPLLVRPQSLVFYAPLVGQGTDAIDLKGAALTVGGTAGAFAHPRIFLPKRRQIFLGAVGGGGGFNPVWARQGAKFIGMGVS